jgi:DNA-binding winged helix-turn-helix (wHTH) protein
VEVDSRHPELILTVPGIGYSFVATGENRRIEGL